jgi:hypothetical protein
LIFKNGAKIRIASFEIQRTRRKPRPEESLTPRNRKKFLLKIFSLVTIFSHKQTFGNMQPFLFGCQVVCHLKKILILILPLLKHKKTQVKFL